MGGSLEKGGPFLLDRVSVPMQNSIWPIADLDGRPRFCRNQTQSGHAKTTLVRSQACLLRLGIAPPATDGFLGFNSK